MYRPSPSFSDCRTCSTEIMQYWHPDSPVDEFVKVTKHINTALTLANRATFWAQNHPVMPPCAERGHPHKLISLWDTGKRAVHAGKKGQSAKACWKLHPIFLKDMELWGEKVFKARQRECRGTALLYFCTEQCKFPINAHFLHLRLDILLKIWLYIHVNLSLGYRLPSIM